MLAGRAEPRRGRARRAARDGRADRERRPEPLATATADSVGYFQIRPSTNFAPAGFGVPPNTKVLRRLVGRAPGRAGRVGAREDRGDRRRRERDADLSDPAALGAWAQDDRAAPPTRTATRSTTTEAHELVKHCASAGAAQRRRPQRAHDRRARARRAARRARTPARASPSTRSAPAPTTRRGARASSPGRSSSPATRCPPATGRRSPTGSAPRRRARPGLELVSAADARPGDLVAYDWGLGTDFGSDGHIGLLASDVEDGAFEAIEGNYQDAVTHTSRSSDDANVVFIRVAL